MADASKTWKQIRGHSSGQSLVSSENDIVEQKVAAEDEWEVTKGRLLRTEEDGLRGCEPEFLEMQMFCAFRKVKCLRPLNFKQTRSFKKRFFLINLFICFCSI